MALPSFVVHKSSLQPHGFLLPTRVNNQSAGPGTDPIATGPQTGRGFLNNVQTEDPTGRRFRNNVQIEEAGHIFQSNVQTVMNNNQFNQSSGRGKSQFGFQRKFAEPEEGNNNIETIQKRNNVSFVTESNAPSTTSSSSVSDPKKKFEGN